MVPVIFSFEATDISAIDALRAAPNLQVKPVSRDRIVGGSELSTILLTLTPVVLTAIVNILKEKWARNAKVRIEARGVKIEGVSPDDVERILKQILADSDENDA